MEFRTGSLEYTAEYKGNLHLKRGNRAAVLVAREKGDRDSNLGTRERWGRTTDDVDEASAR